MKQNNVAIRVYSILWLVIELWELTVVTNGICEMGYHGLREDTNFDNQ